MDRCSIGRSYDVRASSIIALSMIFNTIVMTANFVGHKPLYFFGLIVSSGSIIFPLTYLITAVTTEVYGRQVAILIILMGLICSFFASVYISQSINFPFPEFWTKQAAFAEIMGQTKNIFMLSSLAYILSEFTNLTVFTRLSKYFKGNMFLFRVLCSTLAAVIIDTLALIPIILNSSPSVQIILKKIISLIVFKFAFVCVCIIWVPLLKTFLLKIKNKHEVTFKNTDQEEHSAVENLKKSNIVWINSKI